MSTDVASMKRINLESVSGSRQLTQRILRSRNFQLLVVMVVIAVAGILANHGLATYRVLANVLIAAMVSAFVAMGELLVLITKGIDLSVAPILGLSAVIVGFPAQNHGMSMLPGVLIGAAVGAALGVGNGLLVAVAKMPPIIATLATFSIYSGLQFVVTNGQQVNQIPDAYTRWGVVTNRFLGLPPLFWAGIVVMAIVIFVLRKTAFGRNLYAVGGDLEESVRLGIPTRRLIFFAYVLSGMFAGLAGIVYLMRTGSADAVTGVQTNENLNAIAACLVGGATLTGGRGTAGGAMLGSIFLSLALVVMGSAAHIPPVWQPAGVGVLIIISVLADVRARRREQL
ncbi:MAG: ABC transporter permease [Micrococcales bacterium]|nr:ABC transporter permease [Micrococcales bacterium]